MDEAGHNGQKTDGVMEEESKFLSSTHMEEGSSSQLSCVSFSPTHVSPLPSSEGSSSDKVEDGLLDTLLAL